MSSIVASVEIEVPAHRLAFSDLSMFSHLFTTYCTDFEQLASCFVGDWKSPAVRERVAQETAKHTRDRDTLVEVLLDQQKRWGLDDATRSNIDALRNPESVAVVTGQQVGVFTGPLYTPYKTITSIQLAQQIAEETGRPVVPVFWLEGGDHDLEEIVDVKVMRGNTLEALTYAGHTLPETGNLGPVGRLRLTEQITEVVEQLADVLPPTDFKEALMEQVRAAYSPGTTLTDAFARLMRLLFPEAGLVFIDPDDARLKRLAAPLFRKAIEDSETAESLLSVSSTWLETQGFHAQVNVRPTNLFLLDEAGRYKLDAEEAGFSLRGQDRSFSREEILSLLDRHPERFSPNVVLRPLMQDWILPTAAYVAGPGEVSYFAQYKNLYGWADVPMPVVYPRATVSLVEGKVRKVLDKYGLDIPAFGETLDRLFQQVVLDRMAIDIDRVFKDAAKHLHQAINELKPQVEQIDRTLIKSAEATRAALMKEVDKFKGRVLRAEKQSQEAVRSQLAKAHSNLYPGDKLQERALSILYFVNKYGPDLLARLQQDLSLDTAAHQVVDL